MRRLTVLLVVLVVLVAGAPPAHADPGADYSWYRPTRAELSGLAVVARYLVPAAQHNPKALTAAEARYLLTQGLTVVLNFEGAATGAKAGYAAGVRDARAAELARVEIGAPPTVIYFSADWDVQPSQIPAVLSYLQGVADTIGKGRTGLYGGLRPVSAMLNAGYRWAWQTYAWSHGRWDPRAQYRQTANGALWRGQGDRDVSTTDPGGWWIGGSFPIRGGDQQRSRPVPPSPPAITAFYTVRRGDTLTGIARRYGTTWQSIARLNQLTDPNRIRVGQRLQVTGVRPAASQPAHSSSSYRVRRGDTLTGLARRYGTTWRALARVNQLHHPDRLYVGQLLRLR